MAPVLGLSMWSTLENTCSHSLQYDHVFTAGSALRATLAALVLHTYSPGCDMTTISDVESCKFVD